MGSCGCAGDEVGGEQVGAFLVDFIEDDKGGFGEHVGRIGGKLAAEHFILGDGVAGLVGGKLDEEEEGGGALDVAEEGEAKSAVVVGVFNDAGNVGDEDARKIVKLDEAEVGAQGGKGVGGDFDGDVGEGGDEGRFPGVWHADKAYIGNQLEFELDVAGVA